MRGMFHVRNGILFVHATLLYAEAVVYMYTAWEITCTVAAVLLYCTPALLYCRVLASMHGTIYPAVAKVCRL